MEKNIQVFEYNGHSVSFGNENGIMINATEMAKAFGKRPNDYLSLPSTNELIMAITRKSGNSENQIVTTKAGSSQFGGGTWMHEDLALDFAQWLSVDFKLWCNDRIKELLQYGMTATQPTLEQMINNPDLVISLATQLKNEREEKQRLRVQAEQQQVTIELQSKELANAAPKVDYYDTHLLSENALTTTQIAKEIGLTAEKLNNKLKELGIQFKQSKQWMLKTPYDSWGMHDTRSNIHTSESGKTHTTIYTVWTQRGRRFIIALYENGWDVKRAIKQIKGEMNPAA